MEAITQLTLSPRFISDSAEISEEFQRKTTLNGSDDGNDVTGESTTPADEESDDYDDDEEDEEDFSFSFACAGNGDESPISADDLFQNGQIKPVYQFFDQNISKADLPRRPPVKKVFVEAEGVSTAPVRAAEGGEEAAEMYCAWAGKAVEASPERCKKSNSTGFSKLFRFRDLLNRSNSDGRDAFVFLNGSATTAEKRESTSEKKIGGEVGAAKPKTKKGEKGETSSLADHYRRNRALREGDRRRTYLPYKPEVVGFFTNVHGGLSRNVHPF